MATVPFFEGITLDWLGAGPELELELEELLLLELEPDGGRHGGTISVVTLLLAGSTNWSCAVAPVVALLFAPPGVIKIVLAGGGAMVGLLLLELLELELLEPGEPHGSIATVWVKVLLGITIRFEPGGIVLLPDWDTTAATEHDVTAIVNGLCCFGITTVLTPGLMRAVVTGSELELEEPPPLLPQATNPAAAPTTDKAIRQRRGGVRFLMLSSGGQSGCVKPSGQASLRRDAHPAAVAYPISASYNDHLESWPTVTPGSTITHPRRSAAYQLSRRSSRMRTGAPAASPMACRTRGSAAHRA